MYKLVTLQESVRVPPAEFGKPLKATILDILRRSYEGQMSKELGLVIAVTDVDEVKEGAIRPGDGAAYHPTAFKALTFKPELNEVINGKVIEIVEFGAFISLGALDGLVHVSQITDDFLSYDEKGGRLVGKESKKAVNEGDLLRARIVALSLKKSQNQKVGLTMRQQGLGKFEWIDDLKRKKAKDAMETAEGKPGTKKAPASKAPASKAPASKASDSKAPASKASDSKKASDAKASVAKAPASKAPGTKSGGEGGKK